VRSCGDRGFDVHVAVGRLFMLSLDPDTSCCHAPIALMPNAHCQIHSIRVAFWSTCLHATVDKEMQAHGFVHAA
jgi:hypothetical protein